MKEKIQENKCLLRDYCNALQFTRFQLKNEIGVPRTLNKHFQKGYC